MRNFLIILAWLLFAPFLIWLIGAWVTLDAAWMLTSTEMRASSLVVALIGWVITVPLFVNAIDG